MQVYKERKCATLKTISNEKSSFDIITLSLVGDGSPMKSHPSKTFKISPFYKVLYHSCYDAANLNKTPLLRALISKDIGEEEALSLDLYDFNGLFQHMLMNLKSALQECSYREISNQVQLHERFQNIKHIYASKEIRNNNLVMLSFRIPDSYIDLIYKIKIETLGNAVELAIGYFLITCDELIFNYACLSFQKIQLN